MTFWRPSTNSAGYRGSMPEADYPSKETALIEVGGQFVISGNTDAALKIAMEMDTPEAHQLLERYKVILEALKVGNNGTVSPDALRSEALQMARREFGAHIEPEGPLQ